MNQRALNRAVAKATGESVRTISERGFVPLSPVPIERDPQTVDWDEVQAERRIPILPERDYHAIA